MKVNSVFNKHAGRDELNLVDVMSGLHFISPENEPSSATLSEMIHQQKHKFSIEVNANREAKRYATAGDDRIKNLFKVCCGILNMKLM